MRWWGWGDPARPPALGPRALELVRETVGIEGAPSARPRPPVALASVRLEPTALPEGARAELRAVLGEEGVRDDHSERVSHAAGKGYPDLVRLRAGEPEGAPDAVVYPSRPEQLRAVLEVCARRAVAVVPFGGGTSVVGGVAPLRGEHAAVIALDMRGLGEVVRLDRESRIVTVQAGVRVSALERHLAAEGLTLGHFPQSYEHVSVGGCAATRSAGQASTGYGRFEELVLGLRLSAPAGEIELPAHPASAAGPDLRRLVVGSEGTVGVIHELDLRVRPAPQAERYEGVFFEDFQAGVEALRAMAQERTAPAVARLSDESETRLALAQASAGAEGMEGPEGPPRPGVPRPAGLQHGLPGGARLRGLPRERGAPPQARARADPRPRRPSGGPLAGGGVEGAALRGPVPARRAADARGDGGDTGDGDPVVEPPAPVPRDPHAIEGALSGQGTPGVAGCHVSHLYETGASLYFTLLAAQREGHEIEQWRAVKRAASDAIAAERRHDHPPPRGGPRPRPVARGRGGQAGRGGASRAEGAVGPGGHHEPRQAPALSGSLGIVHVGG